MSLPDDAHEALDAFTACTGWEQRARLLMQWGERLEPLVERHEADRVHGCESQVWLSGERRNGDWHFRADSDARLIRGLLAVLLARVNGLSVEQLAELDVADWFTRLGLARQLSPSRASGMNAVVQQIRKLIERA